MEKDSNAIELSDDSTKKSIAACDSNSQFELRAELSNDSQNNNKTEEENDDSSLKEQLKKSLQSNEIPGVEEVAVNSRKTEGAESVNELNSDGAEVEGRLDKAQVTTLSGEKNETIEDDKYAAHVTYTESGSAIYTDPTTNQKYKWNNDENNWLPCDSTTSVINDSKSASPYENEYYKWCNETHQWLPKAQMTETEHYKWCKEKNEWIAKTPVATAIAPERKYDIDEDGQRIYTDKDGTVFFWDITKKAWFPKIDDDFMAQYQMSYGFIDNTSASEEEKLKKEEEEAKRKEEELARMADEAREATEEAAATSAGVANKRKAAQEPPKWFDLDPERNTKVYVSNLPLDITLDEFSELMSKCGMIMRDPQTQKQKLKLYTEADGQLKGDGLCDYIKVESVNLALKILDEYNLRGNLISVQHAKFQMRGEYNPALKPKRKKKDKEKLQKMKEKLFDWRPEKMRGERSKNEKVVIIKNLFDPEIFEKEVQLILEYQNDLREESVKCGTVRKVVVYDRHAEGVAQVNMSSPEEADLVIQMMNGRFFGKRKLTAEHWDGKTKYKILETETEVQKRLTNWDKFLESEVDKKEKMMAVPESIENTERVLEEQTPE